MNGDKRINPRKNCHCGGLSGLIAGIAEDADRMKYVIICDIL